MNHKIWKLWYNLGDYIYRKRLIFIDSSSEALNRNETYFSSHQEVLRKEKDFEIAFGFLASRKHILRYPFMFWDKKIMVEVDHACIILHNMIVEARRYG